MEKRTSALARILAAIALAGAVVLVIVVVSSSSGGSDSSGKSGRSSHPTQRRHVTKASRYVVKSGDTLVAIAHQTGIPVARIIELNPEVDPQILIAGETLKLR
jgi:LysM repeat protein